MGGLNENKMSGSGRVKVRSHPGETIRDLHDHIKPHLRKQPTSIMVHTGTNDASKSADAIVCELLQLKKWIAEESGAAVAISMPTVRDDFPKESKTIRSVQAKLRNMGDEMLIDNSNISNEHLSNKRLHLNINGTRILVKNMINFIRN